MKRMLLLFGVALLALVIGNRESEATPYWSEEDFLARQQEKLERMQAPRFKITPRWELDEYILLDEYIQICDFLVSMQDTTHTINFGGMHEGESVSLYAIVETDNTQESIRVWSTYAELTGDLETYRSNIEAAWVYTMNFPAYDEEGTTDYYRVHNCGWALVAESRYRQVYGDSSYLWYADSCAWYIQNHRLSYTGPQATLHPLVEGWAAGTLYDYGIEHGDQAAVDSALVIGEDVQAWIEADPNRLWNNEDWAMCGGTALWGVCRSVFTADPSAGQVWLPEYLPYMDTYAGPGQWNNSWNIWYAHAYHASAAVLDDPLMIGYAYTLVDTLLDADTDNDGGIMATSTDPDTMDQSWVSCYVDFMGLEYFLIDYAIDDAVALAFTQPDTAQAIAQGEAYDVTVLVAHFGGLTAYGDIDVQISGAYTASGSTYLELADVDTLFMGQWTPANPGSAELTMTIDPGGTVSGNDTLTLVMNVLGWGQIQGTVADASTGDPISAELSFYMEGQPPDQPNFTTTTDPGTGNYAIDVIEGTYLVVADPEPPYTDREVSDVIVDLGQTVTIDFSLTPAPIVLVDDDAGAVYDTCYSIPLENAGYDVYLWDVHQVGPIGGELNVFDAVIWFTGDETDSALTDVEINNLMQYLDLGGNLLLSGQNIAECVTPDPFLADYLGAAFDSSYSPLWQVFGMEGDPLTAGMQLWFAGAGGAGNQNSTDIISPIGPGELSMYYNYAGQPGAAVRMEESYKSLFMSFGLEGATASSPTSRQDFLTAVLDWFDLGAPPAMIVQVNYVSGSPIPASGGNLYYGIWGENQDSVALDWDGWIDMVYENQDTTLIILRTMTNYQPGWQINRPDVYYPVPGSWPGGNYELVIHSGEYATLTVWHQDCFTWVKEGTVDQNFDFASHMPASFPDPFGEIITTQTVIMLPAEFEVLDAYPNPFNATVRLNLALPYTSTVDMTIYNLRGQRVEVVHFGSLAGGFHQIDYNFKPGFASGIYLFSVTMGDQTEVVKGIFLK